MLAMCEECGELCEGNGKCERYKILRCELKIKRIRLDEYEDFEKRWEEMREIWKGIYRQRK